MSLKEKIRHSDLFSICLGVYKRYLQTRRSKFGYIHPTAFFRHPILIKGVENVYMEEGTHILSGAVIATIRAKFIMKKHSGAAEGLTVVSGNHVFPIGDWAMNCPNEIKPDKMDRDIVVEEDAFLFTNVTLLSGVRVGRGALVGAGAVVRNNVPPYAIVMGNPARVIGFKFTPEQIIEHEKKLYPESEQLPLDKLVKNYNKYYFDRREEIAKFTKLQCLQ